MNRREFLFLASLFLTERKAALHSSSPEIIISGAGDVTLGGNFPAYFSQIEEEYGAAFAYEHPFSKVSKYFLKSDLSIVNFEGTLTNSNRRRRKRFNFKGEPRYAKCLPSGKIGLVNLANNHFMDFREQGALDTIDALTAQGIIYCGGGRNIYEAGAPKVLHANGISVAFLGYTQIEKQSAATPIKPGTNPYEESAVKEQISYAKSVADIVVVSCHWGIERRPYPTSKQRMAARLMADSGADIVFGHHPHVLQGVEIYNEGIIFYSLGNFVFGGNPVPRDTDSMIARVVCSKNGVRDFFVVPVKTHPARMVFQPYVPEDAQRIVAKIAQRSRPFYKGAIKPAF